MSVYDNATHSGNKGLLSWRKLRAKLHDLIATGVVVAGRDNIDVQPHEAPSLLTHRHNHIFAESSSSSSRDIIFPTHTPTRTPVPTSITLPVDVPQRASPLSCPSSSSSSSQLVASSLHTSSSLSNPQCSPFRRPDSAGESSGEVPQQPGFLTSRLDAQQREQRGQRHSSVERRRPLQRSHVGCATCLGKLLRSSRRRIDSFRVTNSWGSETSSSCSDDTESCSSSSAGAREPRATTCRLFIPPSCTDMACCSTDSFGSGSSFQLPFFLPNARRDFHERFRREGVLLGQGAFGSVEVYHDRHSGELVAGKAISKHRAVAEQGFDKAVEDVHREIGIQRLVRGHRGVVQLLDVFESSDEVYLVMELCQGGALSSLVKEKGRLDEQDAAVILKSVLLALSHIHSKGVVHRDVKPENIFLCPSEHGQPVQAKVGDFGASLVLDTTNRVHGPAGTIFYFAPEILQHRGYSQGADVWAAGIVLFVLLSGIMPFHGRTRDETVQRICGGHVEFAHHRWRDVSVEARRMVRDMLTPDPRFRPTVQELLRCPWLELGQ